MKKIAALFLILLTGCKIMLPMSDDEIAKFFPPTMKVFEFSNRCSHICWLGINPGSTTSEEAKALLRSSKQIDSKIARSGRCQHLCSMVCRKDECLSLQCLCPTRK